MALVFKVAARDLSTYVRLAHDQGFDPADAEYSEPQFSGSTAFTDGGEFISAALRNREIPVPLILKTANTLSLHQLIRDIRADLVAGAQVEIKLDGADGSTFFELRAGRLEPQFEYYLGRKGLLRATLHLWVRPFGNTATQRVVASLGPGAGTPIATQSIIHFPATGVIGDELALANLEVQVGSQLASSGRLVAYGVHPSASYNPQRIPSDGLFDAQASSTVVGASGAIASMYYAIPVSPTGASGVAARIWLTPPGGHVGRHRVLAFARSQLDVPITLWGRDRFGAPIGPTAQASQLNSDRWSVIDLGEIHVPGRASGQEPVPTQFLELIAGGEDGAAIIASPALHLNAIGLVPLDISPGLLRTPGHSGGKGKLYGDGFSRFTTKWSVLANRPNAPQGQGAVWTRTYGELGNTGPAGGVNQNMTPVQLVAHGAQAVNNASGLYAIASGKKHADINAQVFVQLKGTASEAASGAFVELWAKGQAQATYRVPSQGVRAKLELTPPGAIAILATPDGGGATTLASLALSGPVASNLYGGRRVTLGLAVEGPTAALFLTGPDGFSAITRGSPIHSQVGNPFLGGRAGANVAAGHLKLDDFSVWPIAGATDASARARFRFQSHPEARVFHGNASVFNQDYQARFRGDPPKLPPTGPSGAARVVVIAGEVDNFLGNDIMSVNLTALEQFSYLK
jgi:hypothetical protein